jgi:putative peptidoglycan lipid II flippase
VATTLGGWLNAGLLYGTLVRRGNLVIDSRLKWVLRTIAVNSAVMGVVVWLVSAYLADMFTAGIVPRTAALAALVSAGLAVYAVGSLALGAVEVRQLRTFLRRRGPAT